MAHRTWACSLTGPATETSGWQPPLRLAEAAALREGGAGHWAAGGALGGEEQLPDRIRTERPRRWGD